MSEKLIFNCTHGKETLNAQRCRLWQRTLQQQQDRSRSCCAPSKPCGWGPRAEPTGSRSGAAPAGWPVRRVHRQRRPDLAVRRLHQASGNHRGAPRERVHHRGRCEGRRGSHRWGEDRGLRLAGSGRPRASKRSHHIANQHHLTRRYEPISLERFRSIGEGENRFKIPDHLPAPCWRNHTTGSADVMGRLSRDKPSVTIRTEFFKPEKGSLSSSTRAPGIDPSRGSTDPRLPRRLPVGGPKNGTPSHARYLRTSMTPIMP
jgi:hypothetical protein